MEHDHQYRMHLVWEGSSASVPFRYETYGRQYRIFIDGKPDLIGSADPLFHGEREKHNPEDLFVAAISSCHMLSFLALAARARLSVVAYEDDAMGTLSFDGRGGGKFVDVLLKPRVTVTVAAHGERLAALHDKAHELCFIASSCSVPIRHEPAVVVEE